MQAKVVLEIIWRLNFFCVYISMETIVGKYTEFLIFICVFSAMLQTSKKVKNNNKLVQFSGLH